MVTNTIHPKTAIFLGKERNDRTTRHMDRKGNNTLNYTNSAT